MTTYRTLISPAALYGVLADHGARSSRAGRADARYGAPVVVDCRFSLADPEAGRVAYAQAHIPGAVYAHLNDDLSAPVVPGETGRHPLPDVETFAARLQSWGVAVDSQVVAYDDAAGAIAARLWWMLRWLGHDRVAVLDGGYPAWVAAGYQTTSDVPRPAPGDFTAHVRADYVVDANEVAARRTQSDWRLFDARDPARFRGDVEPIDAVAGHIPGARSLPHAANVHDGHFRDVEVLRARFQQALGDVPAERSIAYCGSGVTACHDVLAATHAGHVGMKLYAGSWSEWITDASRPIALGTD